jgi:hypothetical protein
MGEFEDAVVRDAVEICVRTMRRESEAGGYRCLPPDEFAVCEGGIRRMAEFVCRKLVSVTTSPNTLAMATLVLLRAQDEAFMAEDELGLGTTLVSLGDIAAKEAAGYQIVGFPV